MLCITTNEVLDLLRATYKTVFISAVDAGREIGLAEKTTRNMLSEGRFPLPTKKIGGKRLVSIFVLADFVVRQTSTTIFAPSRRGPRTKKERIEAVGRV